MKQTLEKLSIFITRLVSMLEEELDEIKNMKPSLASNRQKHVTDTLNKLVRLIVQLNKAQDNIPKEEKDLSAEDGKIISRFLKRHQNGTR